MYSSGDSRVTIVALCLLFLLVGACMIAFRWRSAYLKLHKDAAMPLQVLAPLMERLAKGDYEFEAPFSDADGELGRLSAAMESFRTSALESLWLRDLQEESAREAEATRVKNLETRQQALQSMADRLENETRSSVDNVADLMENLARNAQDGLSGAQALERHSHDVANAADHTLGITRDLGSVSKNLGEATKLITTEVKAAHDLSSNAIDISERADTSFGALTDAVRQISAATSLIETVARQTNLLAINASVEAARSGSAGLGFAVVASEIKRLAEQTQAATRQIGDMIAAVEYSTEQAVGSVKEVTDIIQRMDEVHSQIVTSVQAQEAATTEIVRSIAETSSVATDTAVRSRTMAQEAARSGERSAILHQISSGVLESIQELRATLVRVVRTSTSDVNRRTFSRFAVGWQTSASIKGHRQAVEVLDISEGGGLLSGLEPQTPDTRMELVLPGLNEPVIAQVIDTIPRGVRVNFPAEQPRIDHFILYLRDATKGMQPLKEGGGPPPAPAPESDAASDLQAAVDLDFFAA
jgi:methyl-accepting chemotaxis protein